MDINSAFPSKYLKASDLRGRSWCVEIDRVESEKVSQRDTRPVVYFVGKEKGLVLNKTNSKKIVQITGSYNTDTWGGNYITLYATEVEYQGELVPAIRVKGPSKAVPPPQDDVPPPDDSDEIPF